MDLRLLKILLGTVFITLLYCFQTVLIYMISLDRSFHVVSEADIPHNTSRNQSYRLKLFCNQNQ